MHWATATSASTGVACATDGPLEMIGGMAQPYLHKYSIRLAMASRACAIAEVPHGNIIDLAGLFSSVVRLLLLPLLSPSLASYSVELTIINHSERQRLQRKAAQTL